MLVNGFTFGSQGMGVVGFCVLCIQFDGAAHPLCTKLSMQMLVIHYSGVLSLWKNKKVVDDSPGG